MLRFNLLVILILTFMYIPIFLLLKFKFKKNNSFLFFSTIMFVYFSFVLKYTQFPIYFSKTMREAIGQNVFRDMNYIPLITLKLRDLEFSLLNILLTIPFGFLLSFLKPINYKKSIVYGFCFSFFLEFNQFIIALIVGFSFRVVDVNDLIFNTLGSFLGFLCFKLFISIFKFLINKFKIELNPLLLHIYQTEA